MGTARTTVTASACAQTSIVEPTLARNEPFLARSAALRRTVDGSGKVAGLTRPAHSAS